MRGVKQTDPWSRAKLSLEESDECLCDPRSSEHCRLLMHISGVTQQWWNIKRGIGAQGFGQRA